MQFIDLKKQYSILKPTIDQNIQNVLKHGKFIMGPEVKVLEQKLAEYTGSKYCATCSSGTDALLMPLMAWNVGPGDAVFTTPFTFVSTAEVIQLLGATPVFVDIDPKTYNICPYKLEEAIENTVSTTDLNPKCVIPVDLFGLPANLPKICEIAKNYKLLVLGDAAQGFGGKIGEKFLGSFGDATATSFFPAKPLGCYGDGGAVFTDDEDLFTKLISIRVHGKGMDKYDNVRIGLNGRLDTIQAAILLAKMEFFENEILKRNQVAKNYSNKLDGKVVTPTVPNGYRSAWAQYSVLAENDEKRSRVQAMLKENGIPTAIYYIKPLHLQTAFKSLDYRIGDFPVSEEMSKRIFSLPMHPYLEDKDINLISSFFNRK